MEFTELAEFGKDFKKLLKKYKSLKDDFDTFKKVLSIDPRLTRLGEKGVKRVSGLGEELEGIEVYKVKRFRCFSISKNSKDSGLRIIYHYCEGEGKIEFEKVEFIEIFHKNTQSNHDVGRIKENL